MTADPATDATATERDERHSHEGVGDTVQSLGEQLNPRGLFDTFVGGDAVGNAREAWGIARENPAPVALIAVRTAWLLATSETPAVRDLRERLIGKLRGSVGLDQPNVEGPASGPSSETGGQFDRRRQPAARS